MTTVLVRKRWYDSYPEILLALELLETFPDAILTIIADGVITIAEEEFYAHEILKSVRSLGWEKVSALYKSKRKQRSYDRNAPLHQTMNYLHLMSHENRVRLAKKMLELVQYVYEYLKACREYEKATSKEDIGEVVDVYVQSGSLEARRFLITVKTLFKHQLEEKSAVGLQNSNNYIHEGKQDLQVRHAG